METREDLQRRLSILRKNLAALEEQKAQMGLEVPLRILNEIGHARQQIVELAERLECGKFDTAGRFLGLRPPRIYHNLPQPDYGKFVGREKELADVMQRLRPYPHSVYHHITIDGIGGIGKSALALEVAHRCLRDAADLPEDERFDAIIWTSAQQGILTAEGIMPRKQALRTLDDIYTTISITLQRDDITRARLGEQAELIRNALTQQRTLLIVDNLEAVDDEAVMEFLRELPAPTKVIVTTRHRIDVAYPVRLVGMSWEEAQVLIAQECEKKGVTLTNEEADRLYRRTGGVPLAIVWSVAQIGMGYGVESVLAWLGKPIGDIARYCFEGVVERIRGTDAHKLLMALALFPTDADREALGYVAGFGDDAVSRDEGLVELEKWSLVSKQDDRFSILPLTRIYIQHERQLSEESKNFVDEATSRWGSHLAELIDYPSTYRQEIVARIMHTIAAGESCSIVGVASTAKSNLFRFLIRPDARQKYLGESWGKYLFLYIDANSLTELSEWGLYELLLRRIVEATEGLEIESQWSKLFNDLYQQAVWPEKRPLARSYLERGVKNLCQRLDFRLVFLFDEFDEIFRQVDARFFLSLRTLRDEHVYRISYVVATRDELSRIRENIGECEPFSQLFSLNTYGLGPYNRADAMNMVQRLAVRKGVAVTDDDINLLFEVSGRHPGLLRAAFWILSDRKIDRRDDIYGQLLDDPDIQAECGRVWDSIGEDERTALADVAAGCQLKQLEQGVVRLLQLKGLVMESRAGQAAIFCRLFEGFVNRSSNDLVQNVLDYDKN